MSINQTNTIGLLKKVYLKSKYNYTNERGLSYIHLLNWRFKISLISTNIVKC